MKKIVLTAIRIYQKTISPILFFLRPNAGCRFFPTCSDYSRQAIKKYGLLKGISKALRRIIKCHPFHGGGYDPC